MLPLEFRARADPRRGLRCRRVHPEDLVDRGHEVRQTSSRFHTNLSLTGERTADLADQPVVMVAVLGLAQVPRQPGQRGRRRLAAGRDDERGVGDEVAVLEARLAVAVLAEHVRHKVPAAAGALALGLPRESLLGRELAALGLELEGLGRAAEGLHERAEQGELLASTVEAARDDGLEYGRHPGVIATFLDAPEALGEHEVTDDIERQEVEPGDHVKDLAALLTQLREPEANVLLYDWLLFVHALGTKGMIELAPQPLVVLVGPADW